jgi:hypothetical protein
VSEHQRGLAGALNDARGEDADDAAVPAVSVDDETAGLVEVVLVELLEDFGQGGGLGGAALDVQLFELLGDGLGAAGIFGGEELDDFGSDVHASGGVDARAEAEADVNRREFALGGVELSDLHQSAQTGVDGALQLLNAQGDEGAIFAEERDGVGYGSDGEQLEE